MTISVLLSSAHRGRASPPRLTIGIPTWNRSGRLENQLRSLEPRLTADIELVVCDNGSDDDTWQMLSEFCEKSVNAVNCVRNGANLGADANYLRVIEAASGDWLWMVGDDEDINFEMTIPQLLSALDSVRGGVIMLLNHTELASLETSATALSLQDFLSPQFDLLGLHIHQVGRVVSHVGTAKRQLRHAHGLAGGLLHSYAPIYGTLLRDAGLTVLKLGLYPAQLAEPEDSRWDLLRGHVGAWKMSLIAFPQESKRVGARENRLRQTPLLAVVARRLLTNARIDPLDVRWMLHVFTLKGKLGLLLMLSAFAGSRKLALSYLRMRHPAFVQLVQAQSPAVDWDY